MLRDLGLALLAIVSAIVIGCACGFIASLELPGIVEAALIGSVVLVTVYVCGFLIGGKEGLKTLNIALFGDE